MTRCYVFLIDVLWNIINRIHSSPLYYNSFLKCSEFTTGFDVSNVLSVMHWTVYYQMAQNNPTIKYQSQKFYYSWNGQCLACIHPIRVARRYRERRSRRGLFFCQCRGGTRGGAFNPSTPVITCGILKKVVFREKKNKTVEVISQWCTSSIEKSL